jgi:hypothetical protein
MQRTLLLVFVVAAMVVIALAGAVLQVVRGQRPLLVAGA